MHASGIQNGVVQPDAPDGTDAPDNGKVGAVS